jgi:hypothetical protein
MTEWRDNRKDILKRFKDISDNKHLLLPRDMDFFRANNVQLIKMNRKPEKIREPSKIDLQTDGEAFEGWAIAIKRWLGDEEGDLEVRLCWEPLAKKKERNSHYQRFLYRVIRFSEMFDWFKVAQNCVDHVQQASRVLNLDGTPKSLGQPLLVQVPGSIKDVSPPKAQNTRELSEKQIEVKFENEPHLILDKIGWEGKLKRQVPIGVFNGVIKSNSNDNDDTRVFPGVGARIDLVCFGTRDRLALFELKKSHNHGKPVTPKIGALSEVLFYSHVIRDLNSDIAVFKYEEGAKWKFLDALTSAKSVYGSMLAYGIHPLLNDGEVFTLLNSSFGKTAKQFGFIQYHENFVCEQKWPKQ